MSNNAFSSFFSTDDAGRLVSFPLLFSFLLMLGSIFPFLDNDLASNAIIAGAGVSILLPAMLVIFTGRWWVYNLKLKLIIQIGTVMFFLFSGYYLILDALRWDEWIGETPVMQFGLYYTYSYFPTILFLSSMISMLLVTNVGISHDKDGRGPGSKSKSKSNSYLVMGITFIAISWFVSYVYLNVGFVWAILAQTVFGSFYLLTKCVQALKIRWNRESSLVAKVPGSNGDLKVLRKHKMVRTAHGFFVFLKVVLGSIAIFTSIFINFPILHSYIVPANYIPLWLQFFPIFLIAAISWGVLFKFTKSRFGILLASFFILLGLCIVVLSRNDSYLVYRDEILWLTAFSLSGLIFSGLSYTTDMVRGKFSKILWNTTLMTFILIATFLGFLLKMDRFSLEFGLAGLYVSIISITILLLGLLFSERINLFPAARKKRGKKLISLQQSDVKDDKSTGIAVVSFALKKFKEEHYPRKKMVVAICLVLLTVFSPLMFAGFVNQTQKETVLGTYNGDYYLWLAGSTRSIDSHYAPNLSGSPRNSTVRITMARGEHEGFQVIFTPGNLQDLNVWSFKPRGNLVHNTTGMEIDLENITVSRVDYVHQLSGQYPDRLLPFTRLDTGLYINDVRNWPFYVDVFIPSNDSIDPGLYKTTMRFFCYDYHRPLPGEEPAYHNRIVDFTLEVEVLNFSIPLERHLDTEIIWSIPDDPNWWNFYGDHRMDWYFSPRPVKSYNATPGNLTLTFDWPNYFSKLDLAIQNGMSFFPVSYSFPGLDWETLVMSPESETLLDWYIGNVTSQFMNRTTPWGTPYLDHAYYFIIDEPGPAFDNLITNISNFIYQSSTNITGNSSRIRVMETLNRELTDYAPGFLESIDIYCTHIHDWKPEKSYPGDDEVEGWPLILQAIRDANVTRTRELWVYHTHNGFPTPDTDIYMQGIVHRIQPWLHWVYNITGYLYWSFNWGVDREGGYGYAGFGESTLVGYGEDDEPLSSLRLERFRDGIEDFEYFWMLTNACNTLESNSNLSIQQEATRGRELLEQVNQLFNQPQFLQHVPFAEQYYDEKWFFNPLAAPYLQTRNAIGSELARLNNLGYI
ncbi:MAG: DUF4091 domain-containing protein [Promethearchaeota archaeon]